MKYLILVLSLISCSYSYSQSQIPDLVIPIQFTFQLGGGPINMQVGLDSTATNCLDLQIGESELPPIPPPGWEALIELPYPECQNSFGYPIAVHKDFRFGELPFTGTKTHKFWFRQELGVTIHWNLPSGVTGLLEDVLTGGNIINYPMAGQDTFYVSYNFIDEINMILNYDNVIPVEFALFTASVLQNEKAVQLNWTTATETNNAGFEILRGVYPAYSGTQNDSGWEKIGFVEGHGTTTEPRSYSFSDEDVTTGRYKYRLKQIDYDGTFSFSDVVEVEFNQVPEGFRLYQNYPNPFNPSTKIKFEIPNLEITWRVVFTTLKVYDILGNEVAELVNEEKLAGNYEIEFDAGNLSSGIYFYTISAGNFHETKKMILLR